MPALIGLLLGALLGHFVSPDWGAVVGGFIGFFAGALASGQRQRNRFGKPADIRGTHPKDSNGTFAQQPFDARIAALESRLTQLEQHAQWSRPNVADSSIIVTPGNTGQAQTIAPGLMRNGEAEPQSAPTELASPWSAQLPLQPQLHPHSESLAQFPPPPHAESLAQSSQQAHPESLAQSPLHQDLESSPQPLARLQPDSLSQDSLSQDSLSQSPLESRARSALPPSEPRPVPSIAGPQDVLWAWFTGGNAMTRIGVVVLFFGVAFLLRYFTEHFTIPIQARLLGVALLGVLLIVLGWRSAHSRPAYGASLQGAGTGVLYLTTFAALREFEVLTAAPAFALLAGIAVLTVWLALQAESQALAALALGGAFLAPMLAGVDRDPLTLFGYFALVNAVVVGVAWSRPWRAVHLIGFAATFVLGLVWGNAYYRPEYLRIVEPFLLLFWFEYIAVAILQARHSDPQLNPLQPQDGLISLSAAGPSRGADCSPAGGSAAAPAASVGVVQPSAAGPSRGADCSPAGGSAAAVLANEAASVGVVFGVPLVAFALQVTLVSDIHYGAAWSALGFASVYGVLTLAFSRIAPNAKLVCTPLALSAFPPSGSAPSSGRPVGGLLLSRLFAALAVVFATLAIPFALDNRWTAAMWSVEAALVYWLGLRQQMLAGRLFALVLGAAGGVMFLVAGVAGDDDRLFLNAYFMGTLLVALAGLTTAWLADHGLDRLTLRERAFVPVIFGWGALWWLTGGSAELLRQLPRAQEAHAVLAWITASSALALLLGSRLAWPRLPAIAIALLPSMTLVALRDFERLHTTLLQGGWLLWPLAWGTHLWALYVADAMTRSASESTSMANAAAVPEMPWRRAVHAITGFAITMQVAWELSEWVGRITADDTVWVACAAALPAIAYLGLAPTLGDAVWPLRAHPRAYGLTAAAPLAALLILWILGVNVLSAGESYPLPYVPLANPLDVTLALALWAVFRWTRMHPLIDERTRFTGLGLGLFLSINGAILRAAHHWGEIPWDLTALLQSKPLQATLTLAWTLTGAALMFGAANRGVRSLWMIGATLLAIVVGKLFVFDLGTLSGLPRVMAFMGVGTVLLAIGYLSPLPPPTRDPQ